MKYTLLLTQRCNLACSYCYIGQRGALMSADTATRIVDFAYRNTPTDERIDVGFFGGEPLLEFELVKTVTGLFEDHRAYDSDRVLLTIVTNGTIFSTAIAEFVNVHRLGFGISCDGPPSVHDAFRRFHNGRGSSKIVERNIRRAVDAFAGVMVNAVYGPAAVATLPETVAYFSSLGVRQIYLSPDFTADWQPADLDLLPEAYGAVGRQYVDFYQKDDPHFISLIDTKIAVIMRDGYNALERCRMGRGEYAFTPEGSIYPCERLVGDGVNGFRIGDVTTGVDLEHLLCRKVPNEAVNEECATCGLKDYCMNWCGCSNYFSSGAFDQASPFLCASEKASLAVAFDVFRAISEGDLGTFSDHLSGVPHANSLIGPGALPCEPRREVHLEATTAVD